MALSKSLSSNKGQVPATCYFCETDTPLKWSCLTCDILMCQTCCERKHIRLKNAAEHEVIDIKDIGKQTDELDFSALRCNSHSEQCCMFCTTCDILVCLECIQEFHQIHDLVDIKEGYENKRQKLQRKRQEMETGEDNLKTKKNFLELKVRTSRKALEKLNEDISDHLKEWESVLGKKSTELQNQANNYGKSVEKSIYNDLNAIDKFLERRNGQSNEVEELLKTKNAKKFFENAEKLCKSMEPPESKSTAIDLPTFIPAAITLENIGRLLSGGVSAPRNSMTIIAEYQTNLDNIYSIALQDNETIWVAVANILQKVKVEPGKLEVLSNYDLKVFDMAFTSDDELLLCIDTTNIRKINKEGKEVDTEYNITPFNSLSIHITANNKVIVGGINNSQDRSAVTVMDQKGITLAVYEHDENNQSLFRYPRNLTTTSKCHLLVADYDPDDAKGRVIALQENGDVITRYHGHAVVNKTTHFQPQQLMTTPKDTVIVTDLNTYTLHILNSVGILLTYYCTMDVGIKHPISLALSGNGHLFIGCSNFVTSTAKEAKLYEVTYEGF